jgi:hypothetical protein
VLVLLVSGIYDVRYFDCLRWHDLYTASFMKISYGVQAVVRLYVRNLRGCNIGNANWRDLCYTALRRLHVS